MTTIPTITRHDIRTFIGEQNFQKGQQLAHDGAILNPEQQAMALKAYCYGSLPEPYRVQVTFDGSRINSYLCSCPAGTSVDANMLLHCSLCGSSSRKHSFKRMTSTPSWNDRAKLS